MINNIKKYIPNNIKVYIRNKFNFIFDLKLKHEIKKIRDSQEGIVKKLQKKEILNVIFLVIFDAVWKYEEVYKLLDKDLRFNVKVVVIPHIVKDEIQMDNYNQALNYFLNNGYKTVSAYNNNLWIDLKTILKPDIVFFTVPYEYTFYKYTIRNFLDKFTCYVPYAFDISHLFETLYNSEFNNVLSRLYAQTDTHKGFSERYAINKGINAVTTGYPGVDVYFKKDYSPVSIWKIKDKKIKKIIWAPHHTIYNDSSELNYSSFLELYELMNLILSQYQGKVQIAFKPHPLLKQKLYDHDDWGKEKTDNFYYAWGNFENGQLELGNYKDLFLTSDAIIHDSGSFLTEYLCTSKPALYTMRDKNVLDRMNSFGKSVFKLYYHALNKDNVIEFIENVVLKKEDSMLEERDDFIRKYMHSLNGKSASENIYDDLVETLIR